MHKINHCHRASVVVYVTKDHVRVLCREVCSKNSWKSSAIQKLSPNFSPATHSTTARIFILQQIIDKSWECVKNVYACFVELEKEYHRVPAVKFCGVLRKHVVDSRLLLNKSLYCIFLLTRLLPCRWVKSQPFTLGVGLRQGCVLSPFIFIFCMWNDLLLLASSDQGLQHALDRFAAACHQG